MTQFEVLILEHMQALTAQVGNMATSVARLEERLVGQDRRIGRLENPTEPPPSSDARPRKRGRVTPREATIGGAALVALATSILQALSTPPAAAAPQAPTHTAAQK